MEKKLEVGDLVVYVDPVAKPSNALVTAVWGPTCINVVAMSDNEAETDSYGRQIKRFTSVMHKSVTPAHGNYWRRPDEEPNPVVQPLTR
jgi:hypothetical protein